MCKYASTSQVEMNKHEEDIHKRIKFHCDLCTNYFSKSDKLEEHKTLKHNVGVFPCNECNFKAKSITSLDEHIAQCHIGDILDKNTDMRNLPNRQPCDPSHPSHTTECCNRISNQSRREDRRRRGLCRYWSQGECFRGDGCKFAHVRVCNFQEQCRAPGCLFYHYSEQQSFLEKRFTFREEEFPRMETNRNWRRNQ